MFEVIGVVAYLAIGFVFTRWFIHSFLDNKAWDDSGPVSSSEAIIINAAWGLMALAMVCVLIVVGIGKVFSLLNPSKVYGLEHEHQWKVDWNDDNYCGVKGCKAIQYWPSGTVEERK